MILCLSKQIKDYKDTHGTEAPDSALTLCVSYYEIDFEFIKLGGIVVYMIGKIFIPYGVYEVIKAFRKYR